MNPRLRRNLPGALVLLAILVVWKTGERLWNGSRPPMIEQMLREAPSLIDQLPDANYQAGMEHWFKALAKAGYADDATRMAWSIRRPRTKSQALAGCAIGLVEAQRRDAAVQIARAIPDATIRDQTLRLVSIGLAVNAGSETQQGLRLFLPPQSDGMKSVKTATEIKNTTQRDMGLVDSSRVLRIVSDDASADAADRRITDEARRNDAQASKAWSLALKGQPDAAIDAAAAIRDATWRVHALVSVAEVLSRRGHETGKVDEPLVIGDQVIDRRALCDRAIRAAERAVSEARIGKVDPARAQAALVEVLGQAHRFAEARAAAAAIDDKVQRLQTQARLVSSLAEAGEYAEALTLAGGIAEPRARSDALVSLVEAATKSGKRPADPVVGETVQAIFRAAGENPQPADRSEGLYRAAYALAAIGQTSAALRAAQAAVAAARTVTEPEAKAYALADAAGAWARAEPGARAGEVACEALVAAAPFGSPCWEDGPLQRAGRALTHAIPSADAVGAASSIKDPTARALALLALADIIGGHEWDGETALATKAAAQGLRAAEAIAEPDVRASVVAAAMDLAGRAGLIDQAVAAARAIPDAQAAKRSEAYQSLALSEAEHAHFDRALEIGRNCSPGQRLVVFATIVDVHASAPEHRRFAPKAPAPAR